MPHSLQLFQSRMTLLNFGCLKASCACLWACFCPWLHAPSLIDFIDSTAIPPGFNGIAGGGNAPGVARGGQLPRPSTCCGLHRSTAPVLALQCAGGANGWRRSIWRCRTSTLDPVIFHRLNDKWFWIMEWPCELWADYVQIDVKHRRTLASMMCQERFWDFGRAVAKCYSGCKNWRNHTVKISNLCNWSVISLPFFSCSDIVKTLGFWWKWRRTSQGVHCMARMWIPSLWCDLRGPVQGGPKMPRDLGF